MTSSYAQSGFLQSRAKCHYWTSSKSSFSNLRIHFHFNILLRKLPLSSNVSQFYLKIKSLQMSTQILYFKNNVLVIYICIESIPNDTYNTRTEDEIPSLNQALWLVKILLDSC